LNWSQKLLQSASLAGRQMGGLLILSRCHNCSARVTQRRLIALAGFINSHPTSKTGYFQADGQGNVKKVSFA
jgi:hypothetical protein